MTLDLKQWSNAGDGTFSFTGNADITLETNMSLQTDNAEEQTAVFTLETSNG